MTFIELSVFFDLLPQWKSTVNRGKWLKSAVNIKEANKEAEIYVGRSMLIDYA